MSYNSYHMKLCRFASSTLVTEDLFLPVCSKTWQHLPHWYFRHSSTSLNSHSFLDSISSVAQLSACSWTKTGCFVWTPPSPAFLKKKKKISNWISGSFRRQNIALIHLASRRWPPAIAEGNPGETAPSSAWWRHAETENHAACKSDVSCKICLCTKLWRSLLKPTLKTSQNSTSRWDTCCVLHPLHAETSL